MTLPLLLLMRHALFMSSIKHTHFLRVPQDHISRLQMTFPTPLQRRVCLDCVSGCVTWHDLVSTVQPVMHIGVVEMGACTPVKLSAFTVFFSVTKSVLLYWSGWNVSISQYILYVLIYLICGGTFPFGFQPDTVMFCFFFLVWEQCV